MLHNLTIIFWEFSVLFSCAFSRLPYKSSSSPHYHHEYPLRYEYAATHAPSLFHDDPDPSGPVSLAMAQVS